MTLKVKVSPGSSRSAVTGAMSDGTVKVNVAAAPEKGRANDELCAVLAAHYRVARSAVTIIAGHTGRRKIVRIDGV